MQRLVFIFKESYFLANVLFVVSLKETFTDLYGSWDLILFICIDRLHKNQCKLPRIFYVMLWPCLGWLICLFRKKKEGNTCSFRCFLKCSTWAKRKQQCVSGYFGYSWNIPQTFRAKSNCFKVGQKKHASKDAAAAGVKGTRFLPLGCIDVRAISRSNNPVAILVLQHGSPRFHCRLY